MDSPPKLTFSSPATSALYMPNQDIPAIPGLGWSRVRESGSEGRARGWMKRKK